MEAIERKIRGVDVEFSLSPRNHLEDEIVAITDNVEEHKALVNAPIETPENLLVKDLPSSWSELVKVSQHVRKVKNTDWHEFSLDLESFLRRVGRNHDVASPGWTDQSLNSPFQSRSPSPVQFVHHMIPKESHVFTDSNQRPTSTSHLTPPGVFGSDSKFSPTDQEYDQPLSPRSSINQSTYDATPRVQNCVSFYFNDRTRDGSWLKPVPVLQQDALSFVYDKSELNRTALNDSQQVTLETVSISSGESVRVEQMTHLEQPSRNTRGIRKRTAHQRLRGISLPDTEVNTKLGMSTNTMAVDGNLAQTMTPRTLLNSLVQNRDFLDLVSAHVVMRQAPDSVSNIASHLFSQAATDLTEYLDPWTSPGIPKSLSKVVQRQMTGMI